MRPSAPLPTCAKPSGRRGRSGLRRRRGRTASERQDKDGSSAWGPKRPPRASGLFLSGVAVVCVSVSVVCLSGVCCRVSLCLYAVPCCRVVSRKLIPERTISVFFCSFVRLCV